MEESFTDVGLWIKFAVLFIPLVIYIFISVPTIKWKILLSIGGVVGILLALSGKSLRQR